MKGRNRDGRFAAGNSGGPGNPHARRAGQLRTALLDAVTEKDLRCIIAKLIKMAKQGDVQAAREVLDRVLGKPGGGIEADVPETIPEIQFVEIANRTEAIAFADFMAQQQTRNEA